jgi:hypothetical protein
MSNADKKKPGRGKGRGTSRKLKSVPGKTTTKPNSKAGANKSLGVHVFDYGTKNAANQMATTWEAIIVLAGSTMGEDICNELRNEKQIIIPKPKIPLEAEEAHELETNRRNAQKGRLQSTNITALEAIEAAILATAPDNQQQLATLSVQRAELENEIEQLQHEMDNPPPVELKGPEKVEYDGEWKACIQPLPSQTCGTQGTDPFHHD